MSWRQSPSNNNISIHSVLPQTLNFLLASAFTHPYSLKLLPSNSASSSSKGVAFCDWRVGSCNICTFRSCEEREKTFLSYTRNVLLASACLAKKKKGCPHSVLLIIHTVAVWLLVVVVVGGCFLRLAGGILQHLHLYVRFVFHDRYVLGC